MFFFLVLYLKFLSFSILVVPLLSSVLPFLVVVLLHCVLPTE